MACGCPVHHVKGFLGRRLFTNPWPTWKENTAGDMLRWMRERSAKARFRRVAPSPRYRAARGEKSADAAGARVPQGVPMDGWLSGNKAPIEADFKCGGSARACARSRLF